MKKLRLVRLFIILICLFSAQNEVFSQFQTKTIYVNFEFGKYNINDSAQKVLDELIPFIKSQSISRFEIHGHTDNISSQSFNQTLSENRAKAVKSYLAQKGAVIEHTEIFTHHFSKPKSSNKTDNGRAENRRVELIFVYEPVYTTQENREKGGGEANKTEILSKIATNEEDKLKGGGEANKTEILPKIAANEENKPSSSSLIVKPIVTKKDTVVLQNKVILPKETEIDTNTVYVTIDKLQSVMLNCKQKLVIIGKKGTKMTIDPGTLFPCEDKEKHKVDLTYDEYVNGKDIQEQLPSTNADTSILASAGMVQLKVKVDGKPAKIKGCMETELPFDREVEGMGNFVSTDTGSIQHANWKESPDGTIRYDAKRRKYILNNCIESEGEARTNADKKFPKCVIEIKTPRVYRKYIKMLYLHKDGTFSRVNEIFSSEKPKNRRIRYLVIPCNADGKLSGKLTYRRKTYQIDTPVQYHNAASKSDYAQSRYDFHAAGNYQKKKYIDDADVNVEGNMKEYKELIDAKIVYLFLTNPIAKPFKVPQ